MYVTAVWYLTIQLYYMHVVNAWGLPGKGTLSAESLVVHVFPHHFLAALEEGHHRHLCDSPLLAPGFVDEGELKQRFKARLGEFFS